MDLLTNQRRDPSGCVFTLFVLVFGLANVLRAQTDNESLVDSSPSPWPYYLQVYPGTNPTEEASVGLKSLYFALMMSFGGDFRSSGAIPGVQVALDQINSDPTLLPGYQLHYTLTDSQVCARLHHLLLNLCYFDRQTDTWLFCPCLNVSMDSKLHLYQKARSWLFMITLLCFGKV